MAAKRNNGGFAEKACALVLVLMMFFFMTVMVRFLTRQVLVERMEIVNALTGMIFFDQPDMNVTTDMKVTAETTKAHYATIDWDKLYPFRDDRQVEDVPTQATVSRLVESLKSKVNTYVTKYFICYRKITEFSHQYRDVIQWSYLPFTDGVVKLSDGYLAYIVKEENISAPAGNVIDFAQYCHEKNMDFLYVQAPTKINETQDKGLFGTVDFSNQNADALTEQLKLADVDVYDVRETIEAEGLKTHELFYRTDHHWLAETGLWASRHILEYLAQNYHYDVDPDILNESQFTRTVYPLWLLGSQGKKVTLASTTPDDFSLLYPVYETQMKFSIPNRRVYLTGNFSIVYDMERVEEIDYYNKYPYLTYMYGDNPLAQFENLLAKNDLRLLVIHDSFGDCVCPFLALGVERVDSLDIRHFTGSVESYIEENKPDAVIVLYSQTIKFSYHDAMIKVFEHNNASPSKI